VGGREEGGEGGGGGGRGGGREGGGGRGGEVSVVLVSNHLTLVVLVLYRDRACYSSLVLVSLGPSYQ